MSARGRLSVAAPVGVEFVSTVLSVDGTSDVPGGTADK